MLIIFKNFLSLLFCVLEIIFLRDGVSAYKKSTRAAGTVQNEKNDLQENTLQDEAYSSAESEEDEGQPVFSTKLLKSVPPPLPNHQLTSRSSFAPSTPCDHEDHVEVDFENYPLPISTLELFNGQFNDDPQEDDYDSRSHNAWLEEDHKNHERMDKRYDSERIVFCGKRRSRAHSAAGSDDVSTALPSRLSTAVQSRTSSTENLASRSPLSTRKSNNIIIEKEPLYAKSLNKALLDLLPQQEHDYRIRLPLQEFSRNHEVVLDTLQRNNHEVVSETPYYRAAASSLLKPLLDKKAAFEEERNMMNANENASLDDLVSLDRKIKKQERILNDFINKDRIDTTKYDALFKSNLHRELASWFDESRSRADIYEHLFITRNEMKKHVVMEDAEQADQLNSVLSIVLSLFSGDEEEKSDDYEDEGDEYDSTTSSVAVSIVQKVNPSYAAALKDVLLESQFCMAEKYRSVLSCLKCLRQAIRAKHIWVDTIEENNNYNKVAQQEYPSPLRLIELIKESFDEIIRTSKIRQQIIVDESTMIKLIWMLFQYTLSLPRPSELSQIDAVVIYGLPAAGKTTFRTFIEKEVRDRKIHYISVDNWLKEAEIKLRSAVAKKLASGELADELLRAKVDAIEAAEAEYKSLMRDKVENDREFEKNYFPLRALFRHRSLKKRSQEVLKTLSILSKDFDDAVKSHYKSSNYMNDNFGEIVAFVDDMDNATAQDLPDSTEFTRFFELCEQFFDQKEVVEHDHHGSLIAAFLSLLINTTHDAIKRRFMKIAKEHLKRYQKEAIAEVKTKRDNHDESYSTPLIIIDKAVVDKNEMYEAGHNLAVQGLKSLCILMDITEEEAKRRAEERAQTTIHATVSKEQAAIISAKKAQEKKFPESAQELMGPFFAVGRLINDKYTAVRLDDDKYPLKLHIQDFYTKQIYESVTDMLLKNGKSLSCGKSHSVPVVGNKTRLQSLDDDLDAEVKIGGACNSRTIVHGGVGAFTNLLQMLGERSV